MPAFTIPHQVDINKHSFLFSFIIFLLLNFLMMGGVIAGDANYYEPGRGSQERKAMMNAARIPISKEIGLPLIFVVDVLRTDGTMAYLQAIPVNPDSTPLNWNKTPFRKEWKADMMSDVIMVLLERRNGRWNVRDYIIGPTDVAWYDWLEKYSLPEALFYGG